MYQTGTHGSVGGRLANQSSASYPIFAIGGIEEREASVHKEECGHAGGLVMQTKLTNQMVVNIIINTRCWLEGG